MKTIYFVRHAKSSWDDPMLRDHDRPLNKRGLRDAPHMAARLVKLNAAPDGVLTSSAKRAQQTAAFFTAALGVDANHTLVDEQLYHAWPDTIADRIRKLPEDWDTVLLFGHNPGYTDLANQVKNDRYIDNVPTCGITVATADVDDWGEFKLKEARRVGFMYPKQEH